MVDFFVYTSDIHIPLIILSSIGWPMSRHRMWQFTCLSRPNTRYTIYFSHTTTSTSIDLYRRLSAHLNRFLFLPLPPHIRWNLQILHAFGIFYRNLVDHALFSRERKIVLGSKIRFLLLWNATQRRLVVSCRQVVPKRRQLRIYAAHHLRRAEISFTPRWKP